MEQPEYVRIFDTTLRDGEQSPGATMTSKEKLEVARALSRLGVDVIEAGFPAASPDDLHAVRTIAEQVGQVPIIGRPTPQPPIICGLARATKGDIDRAAQALKPATRPRIHTFLATSPIHRAHKLRMTKAEVLAKIREMVAYARTLCADIEFSPEDGGRTEPEFLYEAVQAAIEAGATTVNIPDTVGYTVPSEFGALIAGIKQHVPGIDDVILSVHCHNDLGLATANTLAGISNGARQAEVAINGIGERAGNTALEEVVMALRTRRSFFQLETAIDATRITHVSRLVSTVTGMAVQPNKAIVGANAFAHEAGIHQDGMLKHEQTYEIMRPETVGLSRSRLVLGKHSGRNALGARLAELGYPLEGEVLAEAFARFKALCDRKKYVTDADLEALVAHQISAPRQIFRLDGLQVACGSMGMPTAAVRLIGPGDELFVEAVVGTGPVDAAFKAVDAVIGMDGELLEYSVRAVTEGIDALGEVNVRVATNLSSDRVNPQSGPSTKRVIFHGHGADTDIIVASVKAYLSANNQWLLAKERLQGAAIADGEGEAADTQAETGT